VGCKWVGGHLISASQLIGKEEIKNIGVKDLTDNNIHVKLVFTFTFTLYGKCMRNNYEKSY